MVLSFVFGSAFHVSIHIICGFVLIVLKIIMSIMFVLSRCYEIKIGTVT